MISYLMVYKTSRSPTWTSHSPTSLIPASIASSQVKITTSKFLGESSFVKSRMKMRESRPARVLPCHQWGLVLTCFTLVCLHTTTASVLRNETSQPTPVLPENVMPSNFSNSSSQASPPMTAYFTMQCQSPAGRVWDHCWLDDNTLVSVHHDSKKVVKTTINRQTKTCTYSTYSDNPPAPHRVACSPGGDEIYVTNLYKSAVWVFDRNGLKAVWEPEGLVGTPYNVVLNGQIVVVSPHPKGPVYVYDRNRVYQAQISIGQNKFFFMFTHLTVEGVFVGAEFRDGHRLVIHDFPHGSTIIVGGHGSENGRFNEPFGISTVGDYILVCDHSNERVPVLSQNGGFEGNLQFYGSRVTSPTSISYRSETKLLVVSSHLSSYIKIFSLMTWA